MSTPDFFRARLDGMVDPRHPLVVLTGRLPWAQIEQVLAPHFERKARTPGTAIARDMLGEHELEFGGGVGSGGRPRLPIRLMASLLYLKNSFNLSDEELVARWSENVVWQFFSGMEYSEPRLPCDATQIGQVLAPHFERKARTSGTATALDMLGEHEVQFGGGVGIGGRPRLPIRLMASLLYL